jgi:glycosyltransferase involved in cell wall biosynthesis
MNTIAILLSTYNGEKYIIDQLTSLEDQSHPYFDLYIRDDASRDNTLQLITNFIFKSSLNITILPTKNNLGAKNNFEVLLKNSLQVKQYKYFMFCDQDDVWFKDKVLQSYKKIQRLEKEFPSTEPLLIYTDLQVVDETLNILGDSLWNDFHLDPKKNALNFLAMQCNITGCTMMFNRKLAELSLPFPTEAIMHDYWVGMVASSLGQMDYLDKATISYRQHENNISGGADKFNLKYIIHRANKFFNTDEYHEVLGRQIIQSKSFLLQYKSYLTEDKIEILEAMISLQSVSFFKRISLMQKYQLYKQNTLRNIGLILWFMKMSLLGSKK